MPDPKEEFRRLVRLTHDKLWLEQRMGRKDAAGLRWPEAPLPSVQESPPRTNVAPLSPKGTVPRPARPAALPKLTPKAAPPVRSFTAPPVPVNIGDVSPEPGPHLDAGGQKERMNLLRETALACTRCSLAQGRTNVVYADGDPEADLMFIGEGPGYDEDRSGIPFVGKAGQLLNKIIGAIEMKREDVFIANIVKCRPPSNRIPSPTEAQSCMPYLLAQIEIVQPRVICLLGGTAAKAMTGKASGITRLRGQWFEYKGIPMMPTFHPAYLLRNESKKRDCWEDMKLVRDKVRELAARDG